MKMTIAILWTIFVAAGTGLLLMGADGQTRKLEERITKLEQAAKSPTIEPVPVTCDGAVRISTAHDGPRVTYLEPEPACPYEE